MRSTRNDVDHYARLTLRRSSGCAAEGFRSTGVSFTGLVVVEETGSIGAATGAVAHLGNMDARRIAKRAHEIGGRGRDMLERRSCNGNHADEIVEVDLEAGYLFGDRRNMKVVHAGYDDRIDLYGESPGFEHPERIHLRVQEKLNRSRAVKAGVSHTNASIDLRSDHGIHRIHGDGHEADLELREGADVVANIETVG